MIGLNKQSQRTTSLLQQATRNFAGGAKKPPAISQSVTDFDIIFVGK